MIEEAIDTKASTRWKQLLEVLLIATVANYFWQLPYAIHQYGTSWVGLPKLSVFLLVSFAWFLWGFLRAWNRGSSGTNLLVVFLVVEFCFYLLHNATGAFLADLPRSNPILLIASALGYLNMVLDAIVLFKIWTMRHTKSSI